MYRVSLSILTRITSVVLVSAIVTLAACGSDEHVSVYMPVGELEFTDPVLKACVVREAISQSWKTSGQMTRLVCTNPEGDSIEHLDGIENLVNLQLVIRQI